MVSKNKEGIFNLKKKKKAKQHSYLKHRHTITGTLQLMVGKKESAQNTFTP